MIGMFSNSKERVSMPKDVRVPEIAEPPQQYRPPASREVDQDAEGNFLSAHRRLKQELADAKTLAENATVELRVRGDIIKQRDSRIAELENRLDVERHRADQATKDCVAMENLFQNIAALTNSFLLPAEIRRAELGGGGGDGYVGDGRVEVTATPPPVIGGETYEQQLPDQERSRDQVPG